MRRHFLRGVQKQVTREDPTKLDPDTIQGIFEIASRRFRLANEPSFYMSSRTDRGVHALRSAAHVDLVKTTQTRYNPVHLICGYNKFFGKNNIDIRVQGCLPVPDTFHARYSAKSRTYLYRLAIRKSSAPVLVKKGFTYMSEIPIAEWRRCHFLQNPRFDLAEVRRAADLLPGTRDFRTFMSSHSDPASTVRCLYSLHVTPGRPLLDPALDPVCNLYEYWDIRCRARSFLHRQVRRMVGALVAVGQGRISVEKVEQMLACPSQNSWDPRAITVPPHGLYLVDVEYDPCDLEDMMPHEAEQQDTVQHKVEEHDTVPHKADEHDTVPHKAQQHDTVPYKAQQHDTVPHKAQQYNTVPHKAQQYDIV